MSDKTVLPLPGATSDSSSELREKIALFLSHWPLILGCLALGLVYGWFKGWTAVPIYRSDALVQVEQKASSAYGASALDAGGYHDLFSLANAELEILKSRKVIESAVQSLNLTVSVWPRHMGSIGAAIARAHRASEPARAPLPFLSRYAWGGEYIDVTRLDLPPALKGRTLLLVAGEAGQFQLYDDKRVLLLEGVAGAAAASGADAPGVGIFVATLKARPRTEFFLTRNAALDMVWSTQDGVKAVERSVGAGVIELSMEGDDPQRVAAVLNAVANAYVRQNVERKSEEATNTLAFLNAQLPKVKAQMEAAEARTRDYQASRGTVDLSKEATAYLEQMTQLQSELSKLDLNERELRLRFTEEHPLLISARDRRARLAQESARIEAKIKRLPATESEFLQLSRDAKVGQELYQSLLNKAQELNVAKAGITGNVRIVDAAFVPGFPVKPNRPRLVAVFGLAGLMLGLGIVYLRNLMRSTLDTPDSIERQLHIPVYATVPRSRAQQRLSLADGGVREAGLLARIDPRDNAVEALRSLRTSLQFALLEARNNIIAVTGPTPGLGKSFASANLACLMSDLGKRVLLVDGDLRKGRLHECFDLPRTPGLTDVVSGQAELSQVVKQVDGSGLFFLPSGTIPPNPSELLFSDPFGKLVALIARTFDLVVFDTPPILNITDGVLIAKHAGACFLVVRAGHSSLHEVETAAVTIRRNGINLSGVVFNDFNVGLGKYGYGKYRYYGYRYDESATARSKKSRFGF